MVKHTKEEVGKEVKQIGLDIFIAGIIIALILGACLGIFIAP